MKEIEGKQRGDKLGVSGKHTLEPRQQILQFLTEDGDNCFTPVFRMYHVSSRKRTASIKIQLASGDLKEFGNYGVAVRNTGEFIDRVSRSLLSFSYGLIDYINFNNLTEK